MSWLIPFNKPCKMLESIWLILPDDVPAHPYAVAMEVATLAPNAEVSIFPWKEPKERTDQAVRHIREFLRTHQPA